MATQLLNGKATDATDRPRPAPVRKPRRVWSSNPAVVLWGTVVGKKVVMAVTGLVLVGFVIAHMLGNLKIFLGAEAINAYALFLRTTSPICAGNRWNRSSRPSLRSPMTRAALSNLRKRNCSRSNPPQPLPVPVISGWSVLEVGPIRHRWTGARFDMRGSAHGP